MTDPQLWRLIYVSRNHILGPPEGQEGEVRAILDVARHRNAQDGVTGALMFNAGCFGQVLEGAGPTVEATFERIQRDPRHGDVTLLDFSAIAARGFPHWSMAFVGEGAAGGALAAVGAGTGFDPSRMDKEDLLSHLLLTVRESEADPVF